MKRKTHMLTLPVCICIFLSLELIFSSCASKNNSDDHDMAYHLFLKSVRMIDVYIDSIIQAPDSSALQQIFSNFNTKITTLNYEFPSDTDLELTEEENDSLIRMHKRLVMARMHMDSVLNKALTFDSITITTPADSVGNH